MFKKMVQHCLIGLLTLTLLLSNTIPLIASAWVPQQYPTESLQQTVGVVAVTTGIQLYTAPKLTAPIVEAFTWQPTDGDTVFSTVQQTPLSANQLFLAFYPKYQLALLPVLDEQADGWVEVALPTVATGKAWLPPTNKTTLYVWQDFIRLYTKNFGFQWLVGVPTYDRSVRLKPEDAAPLTPVSIVQGIKVLHVRGNWMLVELRDLGAEHPIGWLRWRDEQGNLMVWPNFSGQSNTYQAPSNPPDMSRLFDKQF
jgi:hypothetical protein